MRKKQYRVNENIPGGVSENISEKIPENKNSEENTVITENTEITETIYLQGQLKKYKRRYYRILALFFVFLLLFSVYIYLNYDYLVFKHLIAQNYIYTEALDQLYQEHLKRDVKGRYYSFFDNFVISAITQKNQGNKQ